MRLLAGLSVLATLLAACGGGPVGDRWWVHAPDGRELGPLTPHEIRSLYADRMNEILVRKDGETAWRAAGSEPALAPPQAPPPDPNRIAWITPDQAADRVLAARGTVVIFHVYGSWCGPCRDEFPVLVEVAQRFRPEGLTVVAIASERIGSDGADLDDFLSPYDLPFERLAYERTPGSTPEEREGLWIRALGRFGAEDFDGIPYTVILDREGNVVHSHQGAVLSARAWEHWIRPLL